MCKRGILGLILILAVLSRFAFSDLVEAQSWPAAGSWTQIGTDQNEDGTSDNYRDVENIYYYSDCSYLYLRLCCRDVPTFTKSTNQEARFKWFIDLDNNSYISGNNAVETEYLLFSEDTNDILPGEVYLLNEANGDGNYNEWEGNYSGGLVTNTAIAAYRIENQCFDQYIAWSSIGNPANVWLIWTTDNEDPNLEQSPSSDNPDADVGIPLGPITNNYCTTEICDNIDNDCNPATPDGSGEAWYGTACDGADTDLCNEGTYSCTSGAQTCSDNTGSTVDLCNLDRVAQKGLRYTQFHTTSLCSPTRAALITGRNHHSVHTGVITEMATGYPGYDSLMGKDTATVAEVLKQYGWNTAWFGKNHNVPDWQTSQAGPFGLWPTDLGFEHFYGFIGAETNQWRPAVFDGTRPIEPYLGNPDYNFDYDIVDQAIQWVRHQKAVAPDRPFFIYYAPGATHSGRVHPRLLEPNG